MRPTPRNAAAALLALLLLATACTSKRSSPPPAEDASQDTEDAAGDGTTPLTIMEFNIEYGGDGVDFSKVPEAIEASGADVVMVEEAFGTIPKIAEELGWDYVDNAHQLVSRLPLYPSPDDPLYAYIEVAPGKMAAITNVHLTSSQYGPNLIERKDATLKEVLKNEDRKRVKEITPVAETMAEVAGTGTPAFIVGDMNSASHRDWTDEMVGARPQIDFAVEWPVTMLVEDAGFVDSYRALYPDPTTHPGLTWPAWRPKVKGWNPVKGFTLEDRIDYIFSAGPATPTDSFIMGEEGGPDVEKSVDPWPTDHRALVSTFDVDLATIPPAPNLVSFESQIADIGEPLAVAYNGEDAAKVAVVPAEGADGPTDEAAVDASSGTVAVDTAGLEAIPYEVQLQDASGAVLASEPIWLQEPGAGPTVATEKPVYRVGEPIKVSWYGAPANRWDWIGFFKRNDKPGQYMQWEYTKATVAGETVVNGSSPGPWPLEPGKYSVYLLLDDGYKIAAENEFVVK